MSSTLGDLLREVAEPGPNRNSFHSTAHFPSGVARARARGDAWRIKFDLEFPFQRRRAVRLIRQPRSLILDRTSRACARALPEWKCWHRGRAQSVSDRSVGDYAARRRYTNRPPEGPRTTH